MTGLQEKLKPWNMGLAGIALAVTLILAIPLPCAQAQTVLTPGDLKRVNALSGNTVAWAVLRRAVRLGLTDAGLADVAAQSDSVDTIATVLALEDPEGRLAPILAGAARGGLMAADKTGLVASLGLDGSRPKGIACLVYGHAPQDRALLADLMNMSQSERKNCAAHYARIRDYWLKAVIKFLLPSDASADSVVKVDLGPASGPLASARSILIAGETIHEVAYFLRRVARFTRPVTIRGTSCGGPKVDIDPGNNQIIVCYELLAELAPPIALTVGDQTQ